MYEDAKEDLLYYLNTTGMLFVSVDDGATVITPGGRRINTATQLTPTDEARDVGEMYEELTEAQRAHVDPWLEDYQTRIDVLEALDGF